MTDDEGGSAQASDPSSSAQRAIIESAVRVLSGDDRVRGVWLTGSHGKGTNDRYSDVDLWVVVEAADVDAFCRDWPTASEQIASIVLRKQHPGRPVFTHVTSDWGRFDLAVGTPADVERRTAATHRPLYDPSGLSAGLAAPKPDPGPDPARVEALTEEFLRVLGLLPVVVGRDELLVAELGSGLVLQLLIDLMLADAAPEDRGGALNLNRLLPAERLQGLLDLPPIHADRNSVINAHLACAALFLPLARELYDRCRLTWPLRLEDALRTHLDKELTVTLPPAAPSRPEVPVRE